MSRSRLLYVFAALLAALAPVAVLCGWIGARLLERRAAALRKEEQARIVARLDRLNPHAVYDSTGTVWVLSLDCPKDGEPVGSDLNALAELDGLEWLTIYGCCLSDEGIHSLGTLPSVTEIRFMHSEFPNASLHCLSRLPHVTSLTFEDSSLTDEGVRHLAELKSLMYLDILGCRITDAAVKDLSRMTSLERLVLDSTPLSEDAASQLRKALPQTEVRWTALDPADRRPGWRLRQEQADAAREFGTGQPTLDQRPALPILDQGAERVPQRQDAREERTRTAERKAAP